ncbi:MAG: hypothetical protein PHD87_01030 [Candidatus Cloacimonetes bacterium]|nr:hypothetical protein [Candidatus Cloacimonadota bacterium]
MKAFQVIISLLILAALLVSGYVSWLTYKDRQKAEEPLPIEKFEQYLKQQNANPIEIQGWTKTNDGAYILSEITTPDTTVTYPQMDYFWKLKTPTGEEWFHDNAGSLTKIKVDEAK